MCKLFRGELEGMNVRIRDQECEIVNNKIQIHLNVAERNASVIPFLINFSIAFKFGQEPCEVMS
jgi:hypothetical protein